ncbi:MAG: hypothetical protein NXI31_10215 [bacterium]|nr:hypothetical protein [bacterium]
MRHQTARVVITAGLATAFAVAQAPHSMGNYDLGTFELGGHTIDLDAPGGGPGGGNGAIVATRANRLAPSWSLPKFDIGTYQEPDYSMRGMFQQAHGQFMASRNRYQPMASVGLALFPNGRINGEPGSFDMAMPTFDANVPLVLSTEGYVLVGGYYKARHYSFTSATTLADETLHAGGIKLGFGAFLDENTLLEVEFRPGIYSDADSTLHSEDWDAPSHALVTWRESDHLFLKFGLRYNEIYADANVLPYIGLSWDITGSLGMAGAEYAAEDSWRLDIMFPEYVELSYWPTGDTGFSFGFEVDGAEYHVRSSSATGRQRADLRVQEVLSYLGFVHRFTDTVSLNVRGGVTLAGDYELTTGAAGFNPIDGTLDQTFFVQASFGIDW